MEKTILVQASVQDLKIKEFLKLSKSMIEKSTSENGCLTYKLFNNLSKENEFFFYEKYENEKAVEHHNSSVHFKLFIDSVIPLLTKKPIIEMY